MKNSIGGFVRHQYYSAKIKRNAFSKVYSNICIIYFCEVLNSVDQIIGNDLKLFGLILYIIDTE